MLSSTYNENRVSSEGLSVSVRLKTSKDGIKFLSLIPSLLNDMFMRKSAIQYMYDFSLCIIFNVLALATFRVDFCNVSC